MWRQNFHVLEFQVQGTALDVKLSSLCHQIIIIGVKIKALPHIPLNGENRIHLRGVQTVRA